MAIVNGTAGNDFIHVAGDGLNLPLDFTENNGATNGDDTITPGGGSDIVHAGGGNDTIVFNSDLEPLDLIEGGSGIDTILINGQDNVDFVASQMANIELIKLGARVAGVQSVTMNDANVAADDSMTIDASQVGPTASFRLDYSTESDAHVITVLGNAGNDTVHGRVVNGLVTDVVDFSAGGNDSFTGDANVFFGATLSSGDHVVGFSAVHVDGDYSAGLTLTGAMLAGLAEFDIGLGSPAGANSNYRFTTIDDLVPINRFQTFEARSVTTGHSVFIDGSAETDGSFVMIGGAGDDTFIGGAKDDIFDIRAGGGTAGNNVIDGRGGNDTLTGLGGHDTFVFDTTPDSATNVDRITDFSVADDIIALSHAIYQAVAPGALSADAFFIGGAAHDASDRVIYNAGTGALSFDADGNGAGAAVQFAKLSPGLTTLTASQFQITA